MDQRLSFVTVGVQDLEKAKRFYIEKFQWQPLKDSDGIVFFKVNGIIFGLFPSVELAKDARVEVTDTKYKSVTFAINFNSEQEVDEAFRQLKERGVNVIKDPEKVFWGGYSGYVEDVEHNLWEIAYNPFLEMDDQGNVVTHR